MSNDKVDKLPESFEIEVNVHQLMKEIPQLESVLYDLDLMPEQWKTKRDEFNASTIAIHMESLRRRGRKGRRNKMKSDLQIKIEEQIARNRDCQDIYRQLPNDAGAFAYMAIDQDIERAQHAILTQDAAYMVRALRVLQENQ